MTMGWIHAGLAGVLVIDLIAMRPAVVVVVGHWRWTTRIGSTRSSVAWGGLGARVGTKVSDLAFQVGVLVERRL